MNKISILLLVSLLLPKMVFAQELQTLIVSFTEFMNVTILPFLMTLAFLFFIYNITRFFIIESSNEDGREKAKSLAMYGVLAFVMVVIFWGLINMLTTSIGLDKCLDGTKSDYLDKDFVGPPPPGTC